MTLINVTFDRDGGLSIWSDTETATRSGDPLGEGAKCWPSPVLQCAIAVRGDLTLLAHVASALLVPYGAAFDQALQGLAQGGLDAALRHTRETAPGTGTLQHVVIAGWSSSAQRYRAASFFSSFSKDFDCRPVETDLFAPWPPEFGPTPAAADSAAMIAAAERQAAFIKSRNGGYAAGGRLQRTRLLPGGAGIEITFPHAFAESSA
ncbi:MAG: hypothetical protein Kow00114_32900 [Kiloniellaceae bacterium]